MLYFLLLRSSCPKLKLRMDATMTPIVIDTTMSTKGIAVKEHTFQTFVGTIVLDNHATQMVIVLRMNAVMLKQKYVKLATANRFQA